MKKKWYVGIDISKKTLDAVIYDAGKKHADSENYRKVSNTETGFKDLLEWFRSRKMRLSTIAVGMEHTGAYGYDLRLFLEAHGIDYCCFMPLALKRSMGLVRGKNDKVDAERIAGYTHTQRDKLVYSKLSGSAIQKLRGLSGERKRLVRQRAEHEAVLTELKGKEMSGTYARTRQVKEMLDGTIGEIEREMEEVIRSDESLARNYGLLTGIKGIGSVNAIATIIHTDNFRGFETARQYACYLGIAPFGDTSGTSLDRKPKVSHVGAKRLKADLSQAAKSAIVWDSELKAYYERKTAEGKPFGVVLNAVKFKLVCRMFAVVRRGTPFVDLMTYRN